MERKQRVPHLHSLGGYGLISNAKETQPTTFPIFNVAGKCEKNWTLPRKMMLEELERRNYSAGTTRRYLRFVERFSQHFGKSPDKLGPDHLRSYQADLLRELKLCPGTVENHVAALRFLYVRTLRRHEFREFLPYPKSPRKLPNILSQEEVARLINASSSLFQRTLLMALYGTGMRRAELACLKIADIDSQRMIIHVVAMRANFETVG